MHIRLLALDLDGTLLDPGTRIHPETIATLERFVDQGGRVAIDTGRPYDAILRIMRDNDVLPQRRFPHALIAEEREIYLRDQDGEFAPLEPWNTSIIAAEHALIKVAREIAHSVEAALAVEGIVPRAPNTALEDERGFVERYFETKTEAEQARHVALERMPLDVPLQLIRNNRLLAFRHQDVGKGKLLLKLSTLLEVEPHQIMAIGDSHNDLEMLDGRFGFVGGTVANADSQIKDVIERTGGPIASLPLSLGVAELVGQILSVKQEMTRPDCVSG